MNIDDLKNNLIEVVLTDFYEILESLSPPYFTADFRNKIILAAKKKELNIKYKICGREDSECRFNYQLWTSDKDVLNTYFLANENDIKDKDGFIKELISTIEKMN